MPLLGFRLLGLHQGGANWCGQLFDDVRSASHKFGALLDELVWRETDRLGNVSRHAKHLSAEFHGEASRDERSAVLRAFHDHHSKGIPATMRLRTGKFSGAGYV